ncbi:YihY/virulence factor BrkB family protein [Salinarimonas rosea]|uniref:YihY/virulence factor BrkB family protein n=1 Tax=Salinarimonas rosea TaxID=552063 RepID=UPI0004115034|nr:YihY/virulence factor BrkB family protein [Salinarimonas rosea]
MARARRILAVLNLAYDRFLLHDGWAIASHIALSALFSFFPFLILLTALASTFEFGTLADNATDIILDVLPVEIAEPLASEVRTVLTEWRGDLLTIGAALALWFSSNGIEALRVGLNRAYGVRENRAWYVTRLESIVFVVIVAAVMMVFSLAVVLGPLLWRAATGFFPALAPFSQIVGLVRLGTTTLLITVALVITHKFLAAGTRSVVSVLPGVVVTLVLWTVGGIAFGIYLAQFPGAYASTYGGLATAMMSLIFLYTIAVIFIVGGEINGAAIALDRSARKSRAARK